MEKLLELLHLITDFHRILRRQQFSFMRKEHEAGNVWSFYFSPPKDFKIEAGEHLLLNLKHENVDERGSIRFYSPSSAPHEQEIRITTRYFEEKSSSFKRELFNMQPGDKIVAMGPVGKFKVTDLAKEYIFIAGGVGITPFRSILKELAQAENLPKITLYYFSSDVDILFKQELDEIAQNNSQFQVKYLTGKQEVPEKAILKLKAKQGKFYIAGSPEFVTTQKSRLKSLGVSIFNIKFDPFRSVKGGK